MARPLAPSEPQRHTVSSRTHLDELGSADPLELDRLRQENAQLRQLCVELEQALTEAVQHSPDQANGQSPISEYEALLDSKDDTIRQMHAELQEARRSLEQRQPAQTTASRAGSPPREDELLALSEELELERRQLAEDEQSLMEQMRQMEMIMARERAEMARQRVELQRLAGEVSHELERLQKAGGLQSKTDQLRAALLEVTTRRGAFRSGNNPTTQPEPGASPPPPRHRGSLLGMLFGGGK